MRLPGMRKFPMRSIGRGMVKNRRGKIRIWPLILFGVYLLYYFNAHQQTVPITGRSQLVDMTKSQEIALGLNSYRQILANEKVITSGPEVDRLQRIARRIAAVSGAEDFDWEFNLIESPQANAFALPGGKVAVYTGILPITENDDGLAAVLGHEIAHVTARHGAERIAHQRLTEYGTMAVGMSVGEFDPGTQRMVLGALGVGSKFGVLLPFSRKHESEADYIGLHYLARACFDPREAPKLWERMSQVHSGRTPHEFMSTHPSPDTRVEKFQEWMPEALALVRSSCSQ